MDNIIAATVGALIGAIATGLFSSWHQRKQFEFEKQSNRQENISEENAKDMLLGALSHPDRPRRRFTALATPFGGAFKDNEIRRMLIAVGAQKMSGLNNDSEEWWCLSNRKREAFAVADRAGDTNVH